MNSAKGLSLTPLIAICLVLPTESFVGVVSSKIYPQRSAAAGTICTQSQQHVPTAFSRTTNRPSHKILMATNGGKKRRRRKSKDSGDVPSSMAASQDKLQSTSEEDMAPSLDGEASKTGAMSTNALGEVLQGENSIEALFVDDWSGMPTNQGMEKSNVDLPDISTYEPKSKPVPESYEQREKKTAVGLTIEGKPAFKEKDKVGRNRDMDVPESFAGYKSKLPPTYNREQEAREKRAAQKFEEGVVVRAIKTGTWFSIVALVVWEIYINSPLFERGAPPQLPL